MKTSARQAWTKLAGVIAASVLFAGRGFGQTSCAGEWTPDVSPRNGVSAFTGFAHAVYAVKAFDDGSGRALFAGGQFDFAGGVWSSGCARWTGAKWISAAAQQQQFEDFVVYDSGSGPVLYGAGFFGVKRWTGSGWITVGSASGGGARALGVFDPGTGPLLIAGGSFTAMSGVAASKIAAWNGTTWSPLGSGTNGTVYALRSWNDGTGPALYAGGLFTSAGAVSASLVAKWSSGTWSALGAGLAGPGNSAVLAFEVFDDGSGPHLYAGGEFTQTGAQPCNGVAKWSVGSWLPLGSGLTGSAGSAFVGAYDLCVFDPDGPGGVPAKLVAAGTFLYAGGIPARLCAAWDGANWSATSATGFESGIFIWDLESVPVPGGAVLVCAGDFASVAGSSAGLLAQWNGSAWSSIGGGFCQLPPVIYAPPTGVNSVVVHDDGSGPAVFAGGYVSIGGAAVGSYVAKWNGTSVVPFGGAFDGEIETLAVLDDGSGPKLFAGGNFLTVGGVVTGYLVFWSGSAWTALGQIPSGAVHAFTVFDDGSGPAIYAGGVWGIWRWSGGAWIAVPGSPFNVRALAVFDPDGAGPTPPRLFAGFEVMSLATLKGIAQWDGVSWSNLGTGVQPTGSTVDQLLVYDDGTGPRLFLGGWFDTAGGLPANGVARWSGSAWSTVGTGVDTGKVDALVACDGPGGVALYACGQFTSPGSNIARWNGSVWQPLGTGLDARARTMTGFDDGTGPAVIVGGRFQRAGDPAGGPFSTQPSHYLARWGCARPTITGMQTGGAGSPLSLSNSNLVVGHEYFNVFSAEVCGFGPGNGPYLGLCASDPSFLFWQIALPLGVTPIHFLAPSATVQFGPYVAPPMTVDAVCFEWTGGSLGLRSAVIRLTIQ